MFETILKNDVKIQTAISRARSQLLTSLLESLSSDANKDRLSGFARKQVVDIESCVQKSEGLLISSVRKCGAHFMNLSHLNRSLGSGKLSALHLFLVLPVCH